MPGTKSGRNQNHHNKSSNHYAHGRTFTDNRVQQEHLAKLLLKKEKEKNRNDDYFRAQRDAQHRAQETARQEAQYEAQLRSYREEQQRFQEQNAKYDALFEKIYGEKIWHRGPDPFAPNFNRHQEQNDPALAERNHLADQDNHLDRERFRF